MSYFKVEVVRLPKSGKHPNADTLRITNIFAYPVIFKDNWAKEGDLVAYIPVDAMVPVDHPEFAFLANPAKPEKKYERIRAKRLRGIFSMGFLVPAPEGAKEGDDVKDHFGIKKWEEPEELSTGGSAEKDPGFAPHYTDIQNFRRYNHIMVADEEVVVTEKIHGANAMFIYRDGRLWCRSHRQYKRDDGPDGKDIWWKIARRQGLEEKLKSIETIAVFGEVFGQVQDLKYGAGKNDLFLRAFDAFDTAKGKYPDHDEAKKRVTDAGVPWVPELYRGPYDPAKVVPLADGKSILADNIREGIVIKPVRERYHNDVGGRVILKLVSEAYLLRKSGTEHH
jgi:RNA ligase (TIGR02306 family)